VFTLIRKGIRAVEDWLPEFGGRLSFRC